MLILADRTITHKFRNESAGAGGVGQSPKDIRSFGEAIATAINKKLKIDVQQGTGAPSKADISRIVKQVSDDLAKQISKTLLTKLSQPSSTTTKTNTADGKLISILSDLDKHIQNALGKLDKQLQKQLGVKLGPDMSKSISSAVASSIEKAIPKSLGKTSKDFSKVVKDLSATLREISRIATSIEKMRKSGGGIDVTEIKQILSSIVKLTTEIKKLPVDIKQAVSSAKDMTKEQK